MYFSIWDNNTYFLIECHFGDLCVLLNKKHIFSLKFWGTFPCRETVLRVHWMKPDKKLFFFQIFSAIFWENVLQQGSLVSCCYGQVAVGLFIYLFYFSEAFWKFCFMAHNWQNWKSIPLMLLPWNLQGRKSWCNKLQLYLKN